MRAASGDQVIEVIAQFDGAVLEVRHLERPPEPGAAQAALFRVALGGVGLAIAMGLFGYAYVARRTGAWLDVSAVVAFAGGAWALVDGLVRRAELRRPSGFDLLRGLVDGSDGLYPLLRANGSGWELTCAPGMAVELSRGGVPLSLEQASAPSLVESGARAVPLDASTRACVRVGELALFVSSVTPAARQPRGAWLDWQAQSYTASCALGAALFLALLFSVPPDPKSLALDDLLVHQRFPTFVLKPPAEEPLPIWKAQEKPGDDKAGKRAAGPGGKMGTPKSKNANGLHAIKGPPDNHDIRVAKLQAHDQAMKAFHDLFGAREDSQVAAMWAKDDSALGDAAKDVLGGLTDTEVQEAYGVPGGLGVFGKEVGGGGHDHTIGVSDLGTIGRSGWHGGHGYDKVGSLPRDKKKFAVIEPTPGPTKVIGGIDKEIVRRVVHKHHNEVRFCYEKELLKRPDISGRVLTQFTIGGNGVVVASVVQSSTLGDPAVEKCIADAVRRWEFPRPDGGGIVVVQYPFALKFAGN